MLIETYVYRFLHHRVLLKCSCSSTGHPLGHTSLMGHMDRYCRDYLWSRKRLMAFIRSLHTCSHHFFKLLFTLLETLKNPWLLAHSGLFFVREVRMHHLLLLCMRSWENKESHMTQNRKHSPMFWEWAFTLQNQVKFLPALKIIPHSWGGFFRHVYR